MLNTALIRMLGRLLAVLAVALLAIPAAANANFTTWGSNLGATPNADTANGATHANPSGTSNVILPNPHDGQDLSVFNTTVAGGTALASQGGQVLKVTIKGCAVKDPSSPSQQSPDGTGGYQPVNAIEFIIEVPNGQGGWSNGPVAGMFRLPFCGDPAPTGGVYTATSLSTFQPVHMCISPGDTVALHDLGGFVPGPGAGYYPQGIPLKVISQGARSNTASYIGQASSFGPASAAKTSGFYTESGQELMLQVTEGTGEDAYGLCPGGRAVESSTDNAVICVSGGPSSEGYPMCDGAGHPMYAPVNRGAPTISGTPQVGFALLEANGTWANTPYSYSRQWQRCDAVGANCADIAGATGYSYHPTTGDVGHRLRIGVSASNPAGSSADAYSAPSSAIAPAAGSGGSNGGGSTSGSAASTHSTIPALSRLNVTIRNGRVTLRYMDSLGATTTITVLTVARHPRRLLRTTHRDPAGKHTTVTLAKLKRGKYVLEMQSVLHGKKSKLVKHGLTIP